MTAGRSFACQPNETRLAGDTLNGGERLSCSIVDVFVLYLRPHLDMGSIDQLACGGLACCLRPRPSTTFIRSPLDETMSCWLRCKDGGKDGHSSRVDFCREGGVMDAVAYQRRQSGRDGARVSALSGVPAASRTL